MTGIRKIAEKRVKVAINGEKVTQTEQKVAVFIMYKYGSPPARIANGRRKWM